MLREMHSANKQTNRQTNKQIMNVHLVASWTVSKSVVVVVCQRPCEVRAEVGCPTLPTLLGAYVQGRSPPLRQRVDPSSGSQGAGYRNLGHRLVRPRVLVSCAVRIVLSSLITHVCEMMSYSTVPRVGVATRCFGPVSQPRINESCLGTLICCTAVRVCARLFIVSSNVSQQHGVKRVFCTQPCWILTKRLTSR